MKETKNAGTTVPDLGKVQEDLLAAVAHLDSALSILENLPANHSRAIWKSIIITAREDINRYASKLLELLSVPPKANKF